MAWNTGIVRADVVHLDLVLATFCRAASIVVTPRSPPVHKPLRIDPGALVKANPVHVGRQPLSAPAQCSLLNLDRQKSDQHERNNHNASQADNLYSPLSKGHIEVDTKHSENASG
jgi:hypothetical protein